MRLLAEGRQRERSAQAIPGRSRFDSLLLVNHRRGIRGAALATATGQFIGAAIPLVYFARKNSSLLRLTKTGIDWKILRWACGNGSSEMVSNLSSSIVNTLYNYQLMRLAGENGVAAYGSVMYYFRA